MTCEVCKNSFYPESLSGHRWIPNETNEHRDARWSLQTITIERNAYVSEQLGTIHIVYIPRYPDTHHTTSPNYFYVIENSPAFELAKSLEGKTERGLQYALKEKLEDLEGVIERPSLKLLSIALIGKTVKAKDETEEDTYQALSLEEAQAHLDEVAKRTNNKGARPDKAQSTKWAGHKEENHEAQ